MSLSQITLDTIFIMEGADDPTIGAGIVAPLGSFYSMEDGSGFYRKSGALDTDWTLQPSGSFQPLDSDLTDIAALTPSNNDIIQRKTGAWTNRTIAQYLSDLGLGALYQPLDSDLTTISGLTATTNNFMVSVASAWASITPIVARRVLVQEIYLTAGNQTNNSNPAALANITALVTATLAANTRYYFEGVICHGCDNTGGVKFALDVPVGSTFNFNLNTRTSSATAPLIQTTLTDATANGTAFCTQNVANIQCIVSGEISVSGTAAVAQFMFQNVTAAQTATIYQLGTFIKIYQFT